MTAPVTASEYKTYDEKIRAQAEILSSLLSAGIENQDAADKAVAALDLLHTEVQRSISMMTANVTSQISSLAENAATEAARLLGKKFEQANQVADAATKRYKNAGRWLGFKTFMVLSISLSMVGVATWLLVSPLLPSYKELESRRAEITEMEAIAEELSRKGVRLEWTTCAREFRSSTMCFRSDGKTYTAEETGKTYAVPYGMQR